MIEKSSGLLRLSNAFLQSKPTNVMRLRMFLFYQTKNLGKRYKLPEESLTKPTRSLHNVPRPNVSSSANFSEIDLGAVHVVHLRTPCPLSDENPNR